MTAGLSNTASLLQHLLQIASFNRGCRRIPKSALLVDGTTWYYTRMLLIEHTLSGKNDRSVDTAAALFRYRIPPFFSVLPRWLKTLHGHRASDVGQHHEDGTVYSSTHPPLHKLYDRRISPIRSAHFSYTTSVASSHAQCSLSSFLTLITRMKFTEAWRKSVQ